MRRACAARNCQAAEYNCLMIVRWNLPDDAVTRWLWVWQPLGLFTVVSKYPVRHMTICGGHFPTSLLWSMTRVTSFIFEECQFSWDSHQTGQTQNLSVKLSKLITHWRFEVVVAGSTWFELVVTWFCSAQSRNGSQYVLRNCRAT